MKVSTCTVLLIFCGVAANSQNFDLTSPQCITGMIFAKDLIYNYGSERTIGVCKQANFDHQCTTPSDGKTKHCVGVNAVESSYEVTIADLKTLKFTRFSAKVIFCQPQIAADNSGTVSMTYTTSSTAHGTFSPTSSPTTSSPSQSPIAISRSPTSSPLTSAPIISNQICDNLNGSSDPLSDGSGYANSTFCPFEVSVESQPNVYIDSITFRFVKTGSKFASLTIVDPIFCTSETGLKAYHDEVMLQDFGIFRTDFVTQQESTLSPTTTPTAAPSVVPTTSPIGTPTKAPAISKSPTKQPATMLPTSSPVFTTDATLLRCFVRGFAGCVSSQAVTTPLKRIPGLQDPRVFFTANAVYSYELGTSSGVYLTVGDGEVDCESKQTSALVRDELTVSAIVAGSDFSRMTFVFFRVSDVIKSPPMWANDYYFICMCKENFCPKVSSWQASNNDCLTLEVNHNLNHGDYFDMRPVNRNGLSLGFQQMDMWKEIPYFEQNCSAV